MDPVSAVTTVAAATRSVGAWVSRVIPDSGFAAILEGPAEASPSAGTQGASGLDALRDRLQQVVDETLRGLGIAPSAPLRLAADTEGKIRVQSDHPRGAEIEAALSARAELAPLATRLARETGGRATWTWPSLTTSPHLPYTMR